MVILHNAREYEPTTIPLSAVFCGDKLELYPEVQDRKYFEIRTIGGKLQLTAGKYVGFIPLNDRTVIYVEPKMPVGNLVRLLAVAGDVTALPRIRPYTVAPESVPPLLREMVGSLVSLMEQLEIDGWHKRYINVVEVGASIRGAVRFSASMQNSWTRGRRHEATSSYYDLTADIPEHRALRLACHSLLKHIQVLGLSSNMVSRVADFEECMTRLGVAEEYEIATIVNSSKLSPTYDNAMRLASALLSNKSIELPIGKADVFLPSLLIDMEALFEKFIQTTLRLKLRTGLVSIPTESDKPLFDDRTEPKASPDILISHHGLNCCVGDVKYKRKYTREDLNQVITYATSYRVAKALIFLPATMPADAGLLKVGEIQGMQIYTYSIWLGSDDLVAEADNLATVMAAMVQ